VDGGVDKYRNLTLHVDGFSKLRQSDVVKSPEPAREDAPNMQTSLILIAI
jgi:hypothetical protein